jgi:HSP90 family molecular chaperone
MKSEGARGLQGEFGIGLLSFWTVGEELTLTSTAADGKSWQIRMSKGDPGLQRGSETRTIRQIRHRSED